MKKRNQKKAAQSQIDQTARFEQGATAMINTDMGWVQATVQAVLKNSMGILYQISYIPLWEMTGRSYVTVVTGAAIR